MASGFFVPEDGLALVLANQAIYQNLLRSFIDHHQNLADRIDHLIEHNDRPELIRFCHTTKSTTGHMGSSVVQQQAMACELQLKSTPGPLTAAEKADLASLVQNMLHLMDLAEAYLASQSLHLRPLACHTCADRFVSWPDRCRSCCSRPDRRGIDLAAAAQQPRWP